MNGETNSRRGRPIAFLLVIAGGWLAVRMTAALLWPQAGLVHVPAAATPALSTAGPRNLAAPPAAAPAPVAGLLAAAPPSGGEAGDAPVSAPDLPAGALDSDLPEGLDPAPPAHLEIPAVPPATAAAHNAMWMHASRWDASEAPSLSPAANTASQPEAAPADSWPAVTISEQRSD